MIETEKINYQFKMPVTATVDVNWNSCAEEGLFLFTFNFSENVSVSRRYIEWNFIWSSYNYARDLFSKIGINIVKTSENTDI